MTNVILTFVLVLIVGGAAAYIIREKKRGVMCVGCPSAAQCASARQSGCSGGCAGCSGQCAGCSSAETK